MRANPGGRIPSGQVFGRDQLIRRIWGILDGRSLVLSGLRRIGKTQVITKMVEEAPQGKLAIYRDLEGVRDPVEFVEIFFRDVETYLSGMKRIAARTRRLLEQIAGSEFGPAKFPAVVAPHWKPVLTNIVDDLVEHQDRPIIFFWDEVPLMLYNIKRDHGEAEAMELLDTLRSLRQMHPGLRMVFTGSISIHLVISALKRGGYANDPTNDMEHLDVPPLLLADAKELARQLLEGEGIQVNDIDATAGALARAVDGIPYFLHHVVEQATSKDGALDTAIVISLVDESLADPMDRWHLRHFRERIGVYYEPTERPIVMSLLDIMASLPNGERFDQLFDLTKAKIAVEDEELVRTLLMLLQRDHYIVQLADGRFQFRFPLIKKWWRLHRGL